MEPLRLTLTETGLQIEDIPDGVQVIGLLGPTTRRAADLLLHQSDLQFAKASLESIAGMPDDAVVVRKALWRTSIVHLFKCFGSGRRFQLSPATIYKAQGPLAHSVFDHFKNLRNKHFVHDENSYSQAHVCAVLNDGTKSYKVEKVGIIGATAKTMEPENLINLRSLIAAALEWVAQQLEQEVVRISAELEAKPYAELKSTAPPQIHVPTLTEVGQPRKPA